MRTSIATVCLSGTLEEKLQACADAGIDGVEIFEQDLILSRLSPEEIRARAARLGLSLDLYQPFRDLEAVGPDLFAANLRRLEAKFELMKRLGMDTVLLCSNVGTAQIDDDELMVAQLRDAAELAARHGMRIAYEALAWGTFVNTYTHAWDLVRRADHPNLGVCLDSFHILSRGDDPSGIEDIPGEKIFFVQLADAPVLGMEILPWSRHHRVFPGEGDFDLVAFMVHLLRAGYVGPLSLEIFNDVFREADPVVTAVDAARSLLWLQQRTRGALGDDPLRESLASVPKIEPVEAIDHLELRTTEPDEFGAALSALGFEFVGQHRRKSVQLYRRGAVRIVLTPSGLGAGVGVGPGVAAGGAAGGRGGADGGARTTIASVAVRVPDAAAAAQRAVRLGAAPVARPVIAGEAALPGVRAPGGWELVFVDDALAGWPREFGEAASSDLGAGAGAGAGSGAGDEAVFRLDHLNLAESRTHFDAAVLFLESVLRLEREAPLDVPSQRGLVRSQVLRSPEAGLRWILNLVPAALSDGAGVPRDYPAHLAFETDDVVALAERAQAAGLRALPIPANYYEDLAARFDLDPADLATWRGLGLLYDRDARGEFLHFYTQALGGVFLEAVERRGGYAGYGPGDASVRLAAQRIGVRG